MATLSPALSERAHHPYVVDPNGVYSLVQATKALALKPSCLKREVRLGRLAVAKRAGRYFIRGTWLLKWIEDGLVKRRRRDLAETAES